MEWRDQVCLHSNGANDGGTACSCFAKRPDYKPFGPLANPTFDYIYGGRQSAGSPSVLSKSLSDLSLPAPHTARSNQRRVSVPAQSRVLTVKEFKEARNRRLKSQSLDCLSPSREAHRVNNEGIPVIRERANTIDALQRSGESYGESNSIISPRDEQSVKPREQGVFDKILSFFRPRSKRKFVSEPNLSNIGRNPSSPSTPVGSPPTSRTRIGNQNTVENSVNVAPDEGIIQESNPASGLGYEGENTMDSPSDDASGTIETKYYRGWVNLSFRRTGRRTNVPDTQPTVVSADDQQETDTPAGIESGSTPDIASSERGCISGVHTSEQEQAEVLGNAQEMAPGRSETPSGGDPDSNDPGHLPDLDYDSINGQMPLPDMPTADIYGKRKSTISMAEDALIYNFDDQTERSERETNEPLLEESISCSTSSVVSDVTVHATDTSSLPEESNSLEPHDQPRISNGILQVTKPHQFEKPVVQNELLGARSEPLPDNMYTTVDSNISDDNMLTPECQDAAKIDPSHTQSKVTSPDITSPKPVMESTMDAISASQGGPKLVSQTKSDNGIGKQGDGDIGDVGATSACTVIPENDINLSRTAKRPCDGTEGKLELIKEDNESVNMPIATNSAPIPTCVPAVPVDDLTNSNRSPAKYTSVSLQPNTNNDVTENSCEASGDGEEEINISSGIESGSTPDIASSECGRISGVDTSEKEQPGILGNTQGMALGRSDTPSSNGPYSNDHGTLPSLDDDDIYSQMPLPNMPIMDIYGKRKSTISTAEDALEYTFDKKAERTEEETNEPPLEESISFVVSDVTVHATDTSSLDEESNSWERHDQPSISNDILQVTKPHQFEKPVVEDEFPRVPSEPLPDNLHTTMDRNITDHNMLTPECQVEAEIDTSHTQSKMTSPDITSSKPVMESTMDAISASQDGPEVLPQTKSDNAIGQRGDCEIGDGDAISVSTVIPDNDINPSDTAKSQCVGADEKSEHKKENNESESIPTMMYSALVPAPISVVTVDELTSSNRSHEEKYPFVSSQPKTNSDSAENTYDINNADHYKRDPDIENGDTHGESSVPLGDKDCALKIKGDEYAQGNSFPSHSQRESGVEDRTWDNSDIEPIIKLDLTEGDEVLKTTCVEHHSEHQAFSVDQGDDRLSNIYSKGLDPDIDDIKVGEDTTEGQVSPLQEEVEIDVISKAGLGRINHGDPENESTTHLVPHAEDDSADPNINNSKEDGENPSLLEGLSDSPQSDYITKSPEHDVKHIAAPGMEDLLNSETLTISDKDRPVHDTVRDSTQIEKKISHASFEKQGEHDQSAGSPDVAESREDMTIECYKDQQMPSESSPVSELHDQTVFKETHDMNPIDDVHKIADLPVQDEKVKDEEVIVGDSDKKQENESKKLAQEMNTSDITASARNGFEADVTHSDYTKMQEPNTDSSDKDKGLITPIQSEGTDDIIKTATNTSHSDIIEYSLGMKDDHSQVQQQSMGDISSASDSEPLNSPFAPGDVRNEVIDEETRDETGKSNVGHSQFSDGINNTSQSDGISEASEKDQMAPETGASGLDGRHSIDHDKIEARGISALLPTQGVVNSNTKESEADTMPPMDNVSEVEQAEVGVVNPDDAAIKCLEPNNDTENETNGLNSR